MAVQDLREQVKAKLDALDEQALAAVLHYIQTMQPSDVARYVEIMQSDELPEDYDEANDPAIGFLPGSTDAAENVRQVLRDEITFRSGWAQKKD